MLTMHPGEYINDVYVEGFEFTRGTLAKMLKVSDSTISRLIAGKMDLSAEMAYRLEHVFGRSAESWLAMQADFDLDQIRQHFDTSGLASNVMA